MQVQPAIQNVKKLDKKDYILFEKLVDVFADVFEMEKFIRPASGYLEKLLQKPGFHVWVVRDENEVLAGLTAYELPGYYNEGAEIFIYDLAVRKGAQRKGLGSALIAAVKKYCNENAIRGFFVEAHEEDSYAVHFYSFHGGSAQDVVQFNFAVR